MYKDIEFVCTANKGRSPLAEAIAKKYLSQLLGSNTIRVGSSGTLVDFIESQDEEQMAHLLRQFIPVGLEKGILSEKEIHDIKQGKRIKEIKEQMSYRIEMNEEGSRRIIVKEKELDDYIDLNRKSIQTTVRQEAEVILPIDQKNYERVKNIYSKSKSKPIIEAVGDISDPFLSTLDEYREVTNELEVATIKAMEKYL